MNEMNENGRPLPSLTPPRKNKRIVLQSLVCVFVAERAVSLKGYSR